MTIDSHFVRSHLFLVVPLWLSTWMGCGSMGEDPRAWPVQTEVVHAFDASVSDCEPLWATQGPPRLLVAILQGEGTALRLEVQDPLTLRVDWQHILFTPTNHSQLPPCSWQLIPDAQRASADGVWVHLACYNEREAHLIRVEVPTGRVDTLLSHRKDPHAPSEPAFDPSYNGPHYPADRLGHGLPGIATLRFGYYPEARRVFVTAEGDSSRMLRELPTGNPLGPGEWADLNGDGRPEWLPQSSSTGGSMAAGGFSDSTAYFAALDMNGHWLWRRATGSGGGSARLRLEGRRLFGWRSYRNYRTDGVHTRLFELNPLNGSILREARVEGVATWPARAWSDTLRWALRRDPANGTLGWLSRAFRPFGEPGPLRGVQHCDPPALPTPDGSFQLQATTTSGAVWLLNADLRPVGVSPWRVFSQPERLRPPFQPTVRMLAQGPDGRLALVRQRQVPFWSWWTWRHRWGLAWGLSLPAVLLALWYAVRFARLRFHSRRLLEERNRQLSLLVRREQQIQEDERRTIAQDLHDELGQQLAYLRTALQVAGREDLRQVANQALEEMRRLGRGLWPAHLERLGLLAVLDDEGERVCRGAGLGWTMDAPQTSPTLPLDVALPVFRVLQEALTNVIKHARATQVTLRVWQGEDGWSFELQDDGVGFDGGPGASASLGLLGMRERAEGIGADLTVDRAATGGTRVCLRIPVEQEAK